MSKLKAQFLQLTSPPKRKEPQSAPLTNRQTNDNDFLSRIKRTFSPNVKKTEPVQPPARTSRSPTDPLPSTSTERPASRAAGMRTSQMRDSKVVITRASEVSNRTTTSSIDKTVDQNKAPVPTKFLPDKWHKTPERMPTETRPHTPVKRSTPTETRTATAKTGGLTGSEFLKKVRAQLGYESKNQRHSKAPKVPPKRGPAKPARARPRSQIASEEKEKTASKSHFASLTPLELVQLVRKQLSLSENQRSQESNAQGEQPTSRTLTSASRNGTHSQIMTVEELKELQERLATLIEMQNGMKTIGSDTTAGSTDESNVRQRSPVPPLQAVASASRMPSTQETPEPDHDENGEEAESETNAVDEEEDEYVFADAASRESQELLGFQTPTSIDNSDYAAAAKATKDDEARPKPSIRFANGNASGERKNSRSTSPDLSLTEEGLATPPSDSSDSSLSSAEATELLTPEQLMEEVKKLYRQVLLLQKIKRRENGGAVANDSSAESSGKRRSISRPQVSDRKSRKGPSRPTKIPKPTATRVTSW